MQLWGSRNDRIHIGNERSIDRRIHELLVGIVAIPVCMKSCGQEISNGF